MIGTQFPELEQLKRIIEKFGDWAQIEVVDQISYKDQKFPIHCITLGSTRPDVPVLARFGNVLPCRVGLEACAGAHCWAGELIKLGHDAWLITPLLSSRMSKATRMMPMTPKGL